MTAKEYLSRARGIEGEIQQLERLRRAAYERATRCTVPLTLAPVHGQGDDPTTEYAHYDGLLRDKIMELQRTQSDIETLIGRVDDSRYRCLLRARYLEGLTWERIAVETNYSYSQVIKRLHPAALAAVGALLDGGCH